MQTENNGTNQSVLIWYGADGWAMCGIVDYKNASARNVGDKTDNHGRVERTRTNAPQTNNGEVK